MTKESLFRNRKANAVSDSIIIMLAVIAFGIVSMISYNIYTELDLGLQADADLSAEAKQISTDTLEFMPVVLDNGIAVFFFILVIGAIIFAFMIDTNPLFFIVTIVLLLIITAVSALLASPLMELTNDIGVGSSFTLTSWFFEYLPVVVMIAGFLIAISLYIKSKVLL